jgi:hypothetical protein
MHKKLSVKTIRGQKHLEIVDLKFSFAFILYSVRKNKLKNGKIIKI